MALSPAKRKEFLHLLSSITIHGLERTARNNPSPSDARLKRVFQNVLLLHKKGKQEIDLYLKKKLAKTKIKQCGCNKCSHHNGF